jgi:hypothetical protein
MSEPNIFLYTGKQIETSFTDGMYRAAVEGNNFCSGNLKGLIDAISFFHSIYVTTDPVIVPEKPLVQKLGEILAGNSSLEDKQRAFFQMESLAIQGNQIASRTVAEIKTKPVSFGAACVVRWAGKKDLAEVTSVEISSLVADVVHRAELLKELSNRISLPSFMARE